MKGSFKPKRPPKSFSRQAKWLSRNTRGGTRF